MEEQTNTVVQKNNIYPWIVTIIIAAWLVGMAILGAGWLISKEIARQGSGYDNQAQLPDVSAPIEIEVPESKPRQGNNEAKVTVIEFADYQCPYCGQWKNEIYPKLKAEYIDSGLVNFVFWDIAFLGEESFFAAEAAMCAKDQGKFWEYHDKLFSGQSGENENAFSINNLKKFGSEINLNSETFNQCVDSRVYKSAVEESTNLSANYAVNSTPTVFINGLRFEGVMPWENYKQVIESELAK